MTSSFFTQIGNDIYGDFVGDNTGSSVSLSADGNVVAIGSPQGNNTHTAGSGYVFGYLRIYKNEDNTWTQIGSDFDGADVVSLSSDGSVVAVVESHSGIGIYKNVNNTWTQIGSDISGESYYDPFNKVSLSSDGSVVAIGSPSTRGNQYHSYQGNRPNGYVRILKNVNNTWTQIGSDIDGEATGDESGRSVSLSSDGSVVAIGAPYNDGNGNDSGHVRIYKNVNDTWTQLGSDIDGKGAYDESGYSVSLSSDGSIVAIGALYADYRTDDGYGSISNTGHVRIFKNVNNSWTQIGSDIYGGAYRDRMGHSVSLSSDGSVVAIGAPDNYIGGSNGLGDSGHARIYQNINDTWTQVGSNIEASPVIPTEGWDFFGWSVSLSADGSSVAISGPDNDGNGFNSGHVQIYQITYSTGTTLSELKALAYIASNPDLINVFGINTSAAATHYMNHGISEGRSLTSFSATDYLAKYSDLASAFGNNETLALQHYIQSGYAEGRTDSSSGSSSGSSSSSSNSSPTALTDFEALVYIASNPDLISAFSINTSAAAAHYINHGQSEGRSLTSFSATDYLAKYSDLASAFGNNETLALQHYIQSGYAEGRTDSSSSSSSSSGSSSSSTTSSPTALSDFEALNYIASNTDLINHLSVGLEYDIYGNLLSNYWQHYIDGAISHYKNSGYAEGRALDNFDEWGYLASNTDLMGVFKSNTTEAIKHYISYGRSEGRSTNIFNAESYLNNYADLKSAFGNDHALATKHYVESGFSEGRVF